MPIEHQIEPERRRVVARVWGILTDQEVFGYQRDVWSRPEVAGFDELIDMSDVRHIAILSVTRVMDLARLSAGMDPCAPSSKLAIVAPADRAYGLGRMYQTHRALEPGSSKQVGVFRSMAEALAFLE